MAKHSLPVEKLKASKTKPIPVKIVSDGPSPAYAKEDDLRALQRAREIEGDKSRMKAAKAIAKEQMNTLKNVYKMETVAITILTVFGILIVCFIFYCFLDWARKSGGSN
jgi:hypothetical protein